MSSPPIGFKNLRKLVLPEIVVGRGARHLVAQFVRRMETRRTLLVTDPGVIEAGWGTEALNSLRAAGVETTVFSAVSPNPKNTEVMQGARQYEGGSCESIVAVGGGSVLDCAKAIAIVVANEGTIDAFEGVTPIEHACPPIVCIPTTAGSSADLSQLVMVASAAQRRKMAIIGKALVPDVSLVDAETTHTMGQRVITASGVGAMSLAIEAFLSNASSSLADVHALEAVRLAAAHLPATIDRPGDAAHRDAVVMASVHAGIACSTASVGLAHAMAHAVAGMLDVWHGECLACVMPHVAHFNCATWTERQDALLRALVGEALLPDTRRRCDQLTAALREWIVRAKGFGSLAQLGVRKEMIPDLARLAMRDPCVVTNPRTANQQDIERLYEQAL
jgi:alcohol dehydrogenase class IV